MIEQYKIIKLWLIKIALCIKTLFSKIEQYATVLSEPP